MFVISQKPSYTWPVSVEFPTDGGKTEKQTFDGEFKRVSQTRMIEIREKITAGEITDVDLAREVLVGWSGVNDGNGDAVPFSESARDTLLDIPLVAAAVVMAFMQSLAGVKRKN